MVKPLRIILCLVLSALITAPVVIFAQGFSRLQSDIGLTHYYQPVGHIGGGVVIFDINNDGFMDVFLPGGSSDNRILLNNNGEEFIDITDQTMIGTINNIYTFGGISGDFNNDGFEDLFITTWRYVTTWGGPNPYVFNVLMLNNGNNTFTNATGLYNVLNPAMSASATLLDVNHDGYLDIYVANYVEQTELIFDPDNGQVSGFAHHCFDNFLFVSNAGMGYFEQAEIYGVNDNGCGLATGSVDFDHDGLIDLISINDFGQWVEPNKLYHNNGLNFSEISEQTGTDQGMYGMGLAIGDYDEDGHMDFYITNIGRNVLLQHQPGHTWADVTGDAGVENEYTGDLYTTGWGTFFFDYDNDSHLDLYVSNGHIPAAPFVANALHDSNKLYRNNQDGTFEDVTVHENLVDTAMGRGAVVFDFNNDGKLDILQLNVNYALNQAPNGAVLFLNETENDNNFVVFKLEGTSVNPQAIGARVELHMGDRKLIRQVDGGSSHASHSDKRVHFGLGQNEFIDSVLVYWPGIANPQKLVDPEINVFHHVVQEDFITQLPDELNETVRIFPNPASNRLLIEFQKPVAEPLFITLFDSHGKALFYRSISPESGPLVVLDDWIQKLSSGVYSVRLSSQSEQTVLRVVVQR